MCFATARAMTMAFDNKAKRKTTTAIGTLKPGDFEEAKGGKDIFVGSKAFLLRVGLVAPIVAGYELCHH